MNTACGRETFPGWGQTPGMGQSPSVGQLLQDGKRHRSLEGPGTQIQVHSIRCSDRGAGCPPRRSRGTPCTSVHGAETQRCTNAVVLHLGCLLESLGELKKKKKPMARLHLN